MGFQVSGDAATTRTNLGLGDAATKTVGTGAGNVPLNSDLGDAATKTVGTATGNIPLVDNLKTVGGTSIVGTGDIDVGGGKVLQVHYDDTVTASANGSSGWLDTNLSATITPTSATSKILVIVNQVINFSVDTSAQRYYYHNILRGSTQITQTENNMRHNDGSFDSPSYVCMTYLDSPNTTSAVTYKTQHKVNAGTCDIYAQNASGRSYMVLMEVAQ